MNTNMYKHFGVLVVGTLAYVGLMFAGLPWAALGILLLAAISFIALLVGQSKAYLNSISTYRTITIFALILILGHGLRFAFDHNWKDTQLETLMEIRSHIDRNSAKSDVMDKGFMIYRAYELGQFKSISEATVALIGDRLLDNGVYVSDFDQSQLAKTTDQDDDADFFYEIDEQTDLVSFNIVANIPPGDNSAYENANGNTGKLEIRVEVSKEGVSYEVLN